MGVLRDLIKEVEDLDANLEKAEFRYIKAYNEASEITNVARKLRTRIRILTEQTEQAKNGPIRGAFWKAVDEVILLNKELDELLEEPKIEEEEV